MLLIYQLLETSAGSCRLVQRRSDFAGKTIYDRANLNAFIAKVLLTCRWFLQHSAGVM
jgi:hypothetical protein